MSNELKSNEIWLEGQTLEIAKYRKLFKVYGTTWGGDGQTTFGVPDFRNRAIWGSGDGTFGYIEAGLPSLNHTHTRGSMEITGSFTLAKDLGIISVSGAFTKNSPSNADLAANVKQQYSHTATFKASKTWKGSTSQPSGQNSLFGQSDTVQPAALKVRIKCRAK